MNQNEKIKKAMADFQYATNGVTQAFKTTAEEIKNWQSRLVEVAQLHKSVSKSNQLFNFIYAARNKYAIQKNKEPDTIKMHPELKRELFENYGQTPLTTNHSSGNNYIFGMLIKFDARIQQDTFIIYHSADINLD